MRGDIAFIALLELVRAWHTPQQWPSVNEAIRPSTTTIVHALQMQQEQHGWVLQREVEAQLQVLHAFNDDYLRRMKQGREASKTPQVVEFERAQQLKAEGIKGERDALKVATQVVASAAVEVTLGIKADSGVRALDVLKRWVEGLSLVKGVLRAVDENNIEVGLERWDDVPVYIKYNSTEGGDAYMKPYEGGYGGIIFQPKLEDGEFRQYGDIPLSVY